MTEEQLFYFSFAHTLLKTCMTLFTATSLKVEHGIENLWKYGSSTGFNDNYGEYFPQTCFQAFMCSFTHLCTPKNLWYSEHVLWEFLTPWIEDFNLKKNHLLITVDESISTWGAKT